MTPVQNYQLLLGQKLVSEFAKRNFEGYFCGTEAEALDKALELLPREAVISCGGSATLQEIGLIEALKKGGYNFLDPNGVQGAAEKEKVARAAMGADFFLMSANAITESGELVNADGYGNRVSALIFGPRNVLVVAGLNKVETDLEAAINRVRKRAARLILMKFNQNYSSLDEVDQLTEQAVSHLVVTGRSAQPGRIKIILVGKDLGF